MMRQWEAAQVHCASHEMRPEVMGLSMDAWSGWEDAGYVMDAPSLMPAGHVVRLDSGRTFVRWAYRS